MYNGIMSTALKMSIMCVQIIQALLPLVRVFKVTIGLTKTTTYGYMVGAT